MGLVETILEHGGDAVVGQIAGKLGLGEDEAKKAITSLLPQFVDGVTSKAKGDSWWAGKFAEAVESGNHDKYIDEPGALSEDAAVEDGNKILGHVLESKDASREVAKKTSDETGIDLSVAKKALPLVPGFAMGALKKQGGAAALLGKIDAGDVKDVLGKLF